MTAVRARRWPAIHTTTDGELGSRPEPELVLFPGWGFGSSVWGDGDVAEPRLDHDWLTALRTMGPVTVLDIDDLGPVDAGARLWSALVAKVPDRAIWLGWSLGGMLAAELAKRYPDRCEVLVTLASNPCFVARPDWPHAMEAGVFESFRAGFESAPQAAWRRFLGLCVQDTAGRSHPAGHADTRALLRRLRELQPSPGRADIDEPGDEAALLRGLDWLAALDVRPALAGLRCPSLHLLADGDALVPVAAAQSLAVLNDRARVAVVPGVHVLHLCAAGQLLEHLRAFMATAAAPQSRRDKAAVARSFSRAARSYDAVAYLQRQVSGRLLEWLPERAGRWLDLGCGTGAALPALAARAENQGILALDLAEGMVRFARAREPRALWLCGDAEQLPLADASVDGIFSSLAVQWCENQIALWREAARILRPGGAALVATLGPRTLESLRRAWAAVDDRVHVNRFCDRADLELALDRAGLRVRRWDEHAEVLRYPDMATLARELKALGAYNLNPGRPAGLGGRQRLRALEQALEPYRSAAGLPAEYQVWYLEIGHA